MSSETSIRFRKSARCPFAAQLAHEFGRSRCHIWHVCAGRPSPLREKILERQAELMREHLTSTSASPNNQPKAS